MKDLKFLDRLKTGDHEFIPGARTMMVGRNARPVQIPEGYKHVVTKRWKDFVAEKESRGLQAKDGDLVCTSPRNWKKLTEDVLHVGAYQGKFKPWVTTRPAFVYSDGKRPKPISGIDIYSVGTGGLFFVDGKYLVFGGRHWREVGGEIDTPPAGFMKITDLASPGRDLYAFMRESREEVVMPNYTDENGVMKSDYWRNLTVIYDAEAGMDRIQEAFDPDDHGDIVVLKRKVPKTSKYGEEDLYMHRLGTLDRYVSDNAERFGERAALLLKRHFERV